MADKIPYFSAELMAPCGMNCALCGAYLAFANGLKTEGHKLTRCAGCRPRNKKCAYLKGKCEKLRLDKVTYCYECADFPCERLKHLDERYRRNYDYSMIDTLRDIKSNGVESVLKAQRERHQCPRCGGVICIHNGKCYHCDEIKSWRG